MEKIFKPREVDTLIPKLESLFAHMVATQKRAQELAAGRPRNVADPTAAGGTAADRGAIPAPGRRERLRRGRCQARTRLRTVGTA